MRIQSIHDAGVRYEIEILYPVRARKGERKGPHGQLLKNIVGYSDNLAAAQAEAAATLAHLTYGELQEVRYFDEHEWVRDCLTAEPILRVPAQAAA
jgi:hypothetical protein